MPRLSFVLAVVLLLPAASVAQDANRARGDSLRMAGDLVGAVGSYQAALRSGDPEGEVAYALARTFALHPQFADSAFQYLDIALPHVESMKPLWDADFALLADDPRWTALEANRLGLLATQVTGAFDRDYARDLLRMRMNEWAFRYHIMLAFRQLGPESPILTALSTAMGDRHAANLERLEPMLAERGWPALSAVGEEAAYAAGNIVNHSDLATRLRYLPLLEAACEEGEADWSRYAHIFDRTELESGRLQVYGTQMTEDPETGRFVPQPLVDPERVEERRAAKGLEPLADQLVRFNESMTRDFGTGN